MVRPSSSVTVNLDDVRLDTLDPTAAGATLDVGDEISIEIDDDEPRALKTHRAKVDGTVTGLDADARTVTIEARNGESITLGVTVQTEFEDESDAGKDFASLTVGLEVEAKYHVESLELLKLEVESDDDEVNGTITAIDSVANTMTVAAGDGIVATYAVRPNTRIEGDSSGKGGGAITFGQLRVGVFVEVEFDPATSDALEIEVEVEDDDDG